MASTKNNNKGRENKKIKKARWPCNDTTTGPFARRGVGIKSPKVPARPGGKLKFDLPMVETAPAKHPQLPILLCLCAAGCYEACRRAKSSVTRPFSHVPIENLLMARACRLQHVISLLCHRRRKILPLASPPPSTSIPNPNPCRRKPECQS